MISANNASTARFVGLRRTVQPTQAGRVISQRRPAAAALQVRAAIVAEPATVAIKGIDGSSKGSSTMALKVASDETAKGLVHRYLVTVRQNARQVRQQQLALKERPGYPARKVFDQKSNLTCYAWLSTGHCLDID